MKVRALRTALVLVAAVLTMAATTPLLGVRITPAEELIYEREQQFAVESLATVPVDVALTVDRDGWQLEPVKFVLEPGESRTVTIVAAGEDRATITATLRPRGFVGSGVDTGALAISTHARHLSPWETVPWHLVLLAALAVLLLAALAIRRFTRERT